MALTFRAIGLPAFAERVQKWPDGAAKAAMMAINTSARRARTEASRAIRQQVALPASYLNEPGRLFVGPFATVGRLQAVLRARQRPTMLARFGKQATRQGKRAGIRVKVKAGGGSKRMRSAFFVRLNSGNLGIAVRAELAGQLGLKRRGLTSSIKPTGSRQKGRYIVLYGPSVDQVFRTVKDDIAPSVAAFTNNEFVRQFARLAK